MKVWPMVLAVLAAGTVYITFIQAMTLYHKLSHLHSSMLASQAVFGSPGGMDRVAVPENLVSLAKQNLLSETRSEAASGQELFQTFESKRAPFETPHQQLDVMPAEEHEPPRANDLATRSLHMEPASSNFGTGDAGERTSIPTTANALQDVSSTGAIMLGTTVPPSYPLSGSNDEDDMPLSKNQNPITGTRAAKKKKSPKKKPKSRGSTVASSTTQEEPSNSISDMMLQASGDKGGEIKRRPEITPKIAVSERRTSNYTRKNHMDVLPRTNSQLAVAVSRPSLMPYKHQYQCFERGVGVIGEKTRFSKRSCAFQLSPKEVLLGVSVSEGTMDRIQPIARTWKDRISTVLLGAKLHKKYEILVTGVNRDDYRSTLGKGFLGLHEMFKQYPNMKWYGLFDDDCFVNADGLVSALSAFDPNEKWCFSQSGFAKGNWRLYGGAGIILSRGMVESLAPKLVPYFKDLDSRETTGKRKRHGPGAYEPIHTGKRGLLATSGSAPRASGSSKRSLGPGSGALLSPQAFLLDVALPKFIRTAGFTYHTLVGMCSQPPGFYLKTPAGKRDLPEGLSDVPITFHYIRGDYVDHLDFLNARMRLCAVPQNWRSTKIAVGVLRGKSALSAGDEKLLDLTWARNLEKVTFATSGSWGRTDCIIRTIAELGSKLPKRDWYLIVKSSVYVVEQNLRSLVGAYDPAEPVVLGRMVALHDGSRYPDLASGIVLSKAIMNALTAIVPQIPDNVNFDEVRFGGLMANTAPRALQHFDGFMATTSTGGPALCAVTIPSTVHLTKLKPKNQRIEGEAQLEVIDYFVRRVAGSGKLRREQPKIPRQQ